MEPIHGSPDLVRLDLFWFGALCLFQCLFEQGFGIDVDVNKLLFLVLSLHFFVRKRLIENDGPRLGFSEQLVNRNYLHLLTRLADLSLRTFLGRGWSFGLHFCGCNGGNTHMQSFLTPFRKLATIAILLAYS